MEVENLLFLIVGCFLFKKIEKDIENYLELLKNSALSR
jgi:hypothetical protein